MGAFIELLRRLGSATADAAAGFLFSQDNSERHDEEEEQEEQHESLFNAPADSAEVKEAQDHGSALDAICQDITESMDALGAGHDHEAEGLNFTPDLPNPGESMDQAH